ncbi:MAG: hypothetical protein IPH97_17605 [Ignavibacteriales bacterium]|nr:hypothetical protein [Ignavibacteriales bacterium]
MGGGLGATSLYLLVIKSMQKIIAIIVTGFLFNACDVQKEKPDYYKFRTQLTPSGNHIIYDYARYGLMAFSSDKTGIEVFSINDNFEEGEGESIDGVISEWISEDTLLVYNFNYGLKQPLDTLPINVEYKEIADFVVKTFYYTTNSVRRIISDFDTVSTTKDSIRIRIVSKNNEKEIISFPLGGTTIKAESDSIKYIEVSARLRKSMSFIYKNQDGTFTKDLPEVGTILYELKPIKKISPSILQEKKIFWEKQ